ncbi:MAG: VCBS repeat-containing protein [Candidatus Hydrogenedentes bacterium]|nr:VCBS repeat-containing protein [Candidatus Hydrogenedentota bacterium]
MITTIAIMLLAACTGVFDIVSIPLEHPGAQVFALSADADSTAELGVLAKRTLRIYEIEEGSLQFSITLPESSSAFDIFDADGDGTAEVLTIQSNRVVLIELDAPESPPRELFRAGDLFEPAGVYPAPHIFATRRDGEWLVAIPQRSSLELRTLEGELVENISLNGEGQRPVLFERPFVARTVYPNLVGPSGSLEMHIDQVVVHDTAPPPPREGPDSSNLSGFVHIRRSKGDKYQRWPWFSLTTDGSSQKRVLYALCEPDYEDTRIRIEQAVTTQPFGDEAGVRVSPARRYRGSLIPPWQTLPDFNGDGYTDLLLWASPQPGRSIQAVSRALTSRSWPLELRVHYFDREKNHYDPRSISTIETRVPIGWFLRPDKGMPVYLPLFGDFNGDGLTDVAFATDGNEFSVWICGEKGFSCQPSLRHTFPESLDQIEIRADLDGTGRLGAVLRGDRHIFVLKPTNNR